MGLPELVKPEVTGYLAREGFAEGFKKHLEKALQDGEQLEILSRNCREFIVAEHSMQGWVKNMLQAYSEAVEGWREEWGRG